MAFPAWRIEGNPELIFWPKITLQDTTVDFLVRYKKDDLVHWLCLEFDEGGRPSAESLRRERKLKTPLLRINDKELYRKDFLTRLIESMESKLAPLGPGEPESEDVKAAMQREQRQAQKQSRRHLLRQLLTPSIHL